MLIISLLLTLTYYPDKFNKQYGNQEEVPTTPFLFLSLEHLQMLSAAVWLQLQTWPHDL